MKLVTGARMAFRNFLVLAQEVVCSSIDRAAAMRRRRTMRAVFISELHQTKLGQFSNPKG
jgi:hypothetical protein